MSELSIQLKKAMSAAGVKPRSVATLVGCHYTTVYNILRSPRTVPMRVMQERLYDVVDFLNQEMKQGRLPDNSDMAIKYKTLELKARFDQRNISAN